jgi:pimeloyl-ACP methyl ester carboxylesterase
MSTVLKKIFSIISYGILGAAIALLITFVLYVNNKPDLEPWHTVLLKNEFTAQANVRTLDEYRQNEDRLFRELQQQIIDKLPPDRQSVINRFTPGSLSNPDRWPENRNRTYEYPASNPVAGVLMLHGLSDSPYSLRNLAADLHRQGAWVVGLRLPGHGTTPSALTDIRWQDMAAAVRLAMQHLQKHAGDKPLYIVGYSNGASLAIHYALTALDRADLPRARRLVLLSPAIGVTPMAALAVWQERIGKLLGLEKLAWQDVLPEYDPYKYQSFAINAGDLAYRITVENRRLLEQQMSAGTLQDFPPTLAFLSAVDATVSTRSVVLDFFTKLQPNGHELVVFDLNRREHMEYLFTVDPKDAIDTLLGDQTLPFTFTVISNRGPDTSEVALHSNTGDTPSRVKIPPGLKWPDGMYSLSHVALPFPPDDPLYGGPDAGKSPGIALGNVALRGEKGALTVPARDMLRQRWNPFYSIIQDATEEFLLSE